MRSLVTAFVFIWATPLWSADPTYCLHNEKRDPPKELAEAARTALDPDAFVISGDDKQARLRFWFRRDIPVRADASQLKNGLTYREIPATSLVGAVEVVKPFVDFRKQTIPVGVYTIRFAIQPETGDHLGTVPHPEFVLLSPAKKDQTADPMEVKSLLEMSAGVTGGSHPAVMMLYPGPRSDAAARLVDRGDGVWVLSFSRAAVTDSGKATLGFSITAAGHTKE